MGVKERRERERLEIKEKILDAARELFVSQGYEGVSMRKVAEKIEYSPTAIYLHFADKQQLFRELCQADFAKLSQLFRSIAQLKDPVQRLIRIGHAYIDFGARFPYHYQLMFMTRHPHVEGPDECDREVMGNPELDAYAFLKHTVQAAIEAGRFRQGVKDTELISQTLWAAVHGVISLQIAKSDDYWVKWRPLEKRADLMLQSVLRGMLRNGR
jgi:AcrR family transcriptional regulator